MVNKIAFDSKALEVAAGQCIQIESLIIALVRVGAGCRLCSTDKLRGR